MKKSCISIIIAVLWLTALAPQAVAQWSGGGLGTLEQPYLINDEAELAQLAADVNGGTDYAGKYFRLEANLDLAAYGSAYNGGKGWIPVGSNLSFSFQGHFDGNGKTISNLFIDDSDLDNAGLFGYVYSGSVTKLGLVDVNITGKSSVGGLAGVVADNSSVENCYVTGTVTGASNYVGGLAGIIGSSSVENCYVTGAVTGANNNVGGLAGFISNSSSVSNSYFTGTVNGSGNIVGGVAGSVEGSSVTNCYATGSVTCTAGDYVGGVAGTLNSYSSITDCYSAVAVSGNKYVGGVTGTVFLSSITNCYATGSVYGTDDYVGGVTGEVNAISITNCAALNPYVTGTGSNVGRVAGSVGIVSGISTLSNNIAWVGMSGAFSGTNTHDGADGADISTDNIHADGTLDNRFTASGGWATAAGKLPGFGEAVSISPHLLIPLTIIPEAGQSKVYGDEDPLFLYTVSGWQGDDGDHPEDFISVTLARSPGEDVDADGDGDDFYAIYAGEAMSLTEQGAAKYSLGIAEGVSFRITPATLTLTPDDISKEYGDTDPTLEYTVSGWKFSDAETFDVTIEREAGENVGEYEIGISAAALSAPNTNYVLAYDATATFTITPKPAPVNWPNLSLSYGGVPLAPFASALDKDGGYLTINVSGAQTAVGTGYEAVATCANTNYKLTGDTVYFSIAKAVGEPLSSEVVLDSATYNSITVLAIADASNGQTAEYAISETAGSPPTSGWQDSPTFTGLQSAHSYYVYARTAENESYESGGIPKQSAALYTDIGVTGVTIAPDTASIHRGDSLQFSAAVSGGSTAPKTVNWYVDGAAHAGTTVDANGRLRVHADESALALTVRAVSTVDATKADTAGVSLYVKKIMDNGTVVITPPGGDPNDNPDGSITLPDGGTVIPPVEGEPVDAPEEDGKVEIAVPPGTVVDNDGKTTLPPSNGGTATYPDTGTEIDLPPGTVIDGDGKIVIPDDGEASVTYPGDGTEIDLPPSTEIKVDDEGRIVITPGEDGATVDPGDGSPDVTVPGDGSEIIIDPEDGILILRDPKNLMFTHSPDPMTAVYNGSQQPITVSQTPESAGIITGTITVKYNGSATAPTNAGTYAVTVDVGASTTNKAANLSLGNYVISKAAGAATAVPTLDSASFNSISVLAIGDASNGQSVEYAIATSDASTPTDGWQSSPGFAGLLSAHTYYIYARTAENTNYQTGAAQHSVAITTDGGVSSVTISPDTASVQKGSTQAFTVVVDGGASVSKTGSWSITGQNSAGTSINSEGLLTVALNETASALRVRVTSTFDGSQFAEAGVSLYVKRIMDNGTVLITPPGGDPIDSDGGDSISLPNGGTVIPPVDGEPVNVPSEDGKVEIAVPPGTVVDNDGKVSFPPTDENGNGDGGTATYPDTNTEIDLPAGSIIDGEGKITLPDEGEGKATYPGDGSEIDLPPSTEIKVDDEGRIVITPGDDSATISKPDGSPDITVPNDGSEIIIDPNDGIQVVLVPNTSHFVYPDPMSAVYNGAAQPITVTPASGVSGMDAITVYYDGSTTAPTNAGVYAITIDVAASEHNKAASGLALGDYEIAKADIAVVWGSTTLPYSGGAQTPTATATGVLGEEIALNISGEQSAIGTGYTATAEFASTEANYTLSNSSTVFEITINPVYEYTVSFDSQGGSAVAAQLVPYGGTASLPAEPVREKHIFEGWFRTDACNEDEKWDFDANLITADTIVYAGWTEILSHDADLVAVVVNDSHVHGTLVDGNLKYQANCNESEVKIEVTASSGARIFVNGEDHGTSTTVQLTGEVEKIYISVRSESNATVKDYILTATTALSGERLYFQRWDDVLSINHNPNNNGGRTITGVRWYKDNVFMGLGRYIEIEGAATSYYAEVEVDGEWHKICHYTGVKTISILAYPNPVSRGEALTLQLPETFVGGTLSIYNVSGRLIKSNITLPMVFSDISVDELPTGIYLFKVNSINGNSETVKVIIN